MPTEDENLDNRSLMATTVPGMAGGGTDEICGVYTKHCRIIAARAKAAELLKLFQQDFNFLDVLFALAWENIKQIYIKPLEENIKRLAYLCDVGMQLGDDVMSRLGIAKLPEERINDFHDHFEKEHEALLEFNRMCHAALECLSTHPKRQVSGVP